LRAHIVRWLWVCTNQQVERKRLETSDHSSLGRENSRRDLEQRAKAALEKVRREIESKLKIK
jgi:hypothetical protein